MSTKLFTLKTNFFGASSPLEERAALFKALYQEHNQYVRKTLFWIVGEEFVDDAVQETFINIWKKIDQFQGQSQIKTWIYRVAVNSGLSILRRNKKNKDNKIIL